ncbi:MAG: dTDP-4-dehydrorhamnose 3,5-epimerase [Nitrospira sp.]|nr:dTDP-4-dehydrorhamnose 3,5-epimerase [Nitrospira sp.]
MDNGVRTGVIEGVEVISLRKIPDERGSIYHMLRADEKHFVAFGEVYFSKVYPGVIKGWHVHKIMTQNYAVPVGMIKLVLCDLRTGSSTEKRLMELFIGDDNYCLVKIPPGIASGYKGIGDVPALVANCATHPHIPHGEMERIDPMSNVIPYRWDVVHR